MNDHVILVDHEDKAIGTIGKLEAHQQGLLHRAVSVFIFNESNQMLLQQREKTKYHSGGLWSNACCTHPKWEESTEDTSHRRLREEMGINAPLFKAFEFTYKAALDNDLIEYEYDHVYLGVTNEKPNGNPEEVMDWKYLSIEQIEFDLKKNPHLYTEWFKLCLPKVTRLINQNILNKLNNQFYEHVI